MAQAVQRNRRGRIEVLTLRGPLDAALCQAVAEALADAMAEATVASVVIAPDRATLCSGAVEGLPHLCAVLDACGKPVVIGLAGDVLDAGLELALAAHFRLATRDVRLGFPMVGLGLLPGAGGTQRLTRIVGAQIALDVLAGGLLDAARAEAAGLIDGIVRAGLEPTVMALARRLAASAAGPRASRDRIEGRRDLVAASAALSRARDTAGRSSLEVAGAAVEAVAAAVARPWAEGCAIEAALAAQLRATPQAGALAQVARAEARAVPETRAAPFPVERIACLVGPIPDADPGAAGRIAALLRAGFVVTLVAEGADCLHRWRAAVGPDGADLKGATSLDAAAPPDLALVFPGAARPILTSPYASPDASRMAEVQDPVRGGVVAGRFALRFAPLEAATPLVEVLAADPGALATAVAVVQRLGGRPLLVESTAGLVGPLFAALLHAMEALVEDGATPAQVDAALLRHGYAQGIFAMADARGLAADAHVRRAQAHRRDPLARYVVLADRLCALGRVGRAAGGGYLCDEGGGDDPVLHEVLAAMRHSAGVVPRAVPDREIAERADLVLALAGLRLLGAGATGDPDRIDLAAVAGLGFARWRGGPLRLATALGPEAVEARRAVFSRSDAALWACPALLQALLPGSERRRHGPDPTARQETSRWT